MTPALAEVVLKTPPATYGPWAAATIGSVIGPRSLLVTDGETHRADRKLLTPPFHGRRMKAHGEQMQGWDVELLEPDEQPARRSITMGPENGVPVRILGRRIV